MRSTLLTLALSALAAAPALAAPSGDKWYADYDEALAVAKEQQKDLLVDFTGSDWCGWCKKLDAEVFSHDAFLNGVGDQYVLVALDFPNAPEIKAQVPNPDRNAELRDRWGVRGYPTIMLVNVEDQPFAQTGYRAGGPEAYVEHLTEIASSGRETLREMGKLVDALDGAEGTAREQALGALVDLLERQASGSPFVSELVGYAKQTLALETESGQLLKLRAVEALLGAGIYDDELGTAIATLDPENERGLRERAMMARMTALQSIEQVGTWVDDAVALIEAVELRDQEVARDLYVNIAFMSDKYLEQPDRAKKFARLAIELGNVDDERTLQMLRDMIGVDEQSS